nr:MAG TPA: helix-turn-helix domain protein [Caudoviricetes sp.]
MDKLLYPRIEAAKLLSISVDTLDALAQSGEIKNLRIGARVYYTMEALKTFITKEGPVC